MGLSAIYFLVTYFSCLVNLNWDLKRLNLRLFGQVNPEP